MISINAAQEIVLKHTKQINSESVPLLEAIGRIIAVDMRAPHDLPLSNNSAMDGYALALRPGQEQWNVVDFIPAGLLRTAPVPQGDTVKIMTGAPVPAGCDTVVPIEDVVEDAGVIRMSHSLKRGSHIRKQGEDIQRGNLLIKSGSPVRPQEIGLLAAFGWATLPVYRKPRIAILSTGDELMEIGSSPRPGKIINSNSYSLAAQLVQAGGEPVLIGIAADTRKATRDKIVEGLQADGLIISGGASVGDRDFVRETILELQGELQFSKVNMKPGKPATFATIESKPVFALPGNPVAAMVCFEMFVRPAILKMLGHSQLMRPKIKAVLSGQVLNSGERPHLVSVRVASEGDSYKVSTISNQSSANLASLTAGNGLLRLEPHSLLLADSVVEITLLDPDLGTGDIFYGTL